MNASTVFGRHGHTERPGHVEQLVAAQGVARVAKRHSSSANSRGVRSTGRPATATGRRDSSRTIGPLTSCRAGVRAVCPPPAGRAPGAAPTSSS